VDFARAHPNIVYAYRLLAVGHIPFVVLEHAQGHATLRQTLTARTARKDAIFEDAVVYGLQIAYGMLYAHDKAKLVHGDLKPENLLFTENGTLKITDFGLSVAVDQQSPTGNRIRGTPQYMSPEQWRGEHLDARSDIYATGVILYEVVTGRRPFPSEDAAELYRLHLNAVPPAPRRIDPSIPEGLNVLVMECLEKDRSRRPASFEVFIERLRALPTGRPADPPASFPAPESSEATFNLIKSLRALGRHDEAVSLGKRAVSEFPNDGRLHCALADALMESGRPDQATAALLRALKARKLNDLDRQDATVKLTLAYFACGDVPFANVWYKRALKEKRYPEKLAALTTFMTAQGKPEESLALCDRIIAQRPTNATVWNNRAIALRRQGYLQQALESATRACTINPRHAKAWSNRATALLLMGRFDQAAEAAEKALEIEPLTEGALLALTSALRHLGNPDPTSRSENGRSIVQGAAALRECNIWQPRI
jgi:tetratricopeptide (TPR) repeat protein